MEVLLSASIFSLLVTALVGAFLYGQESSALAGARARAGQLADEGLEASRSIRDGSFASLVDGAHGLTVSGGVWTYSGTQDVTGQFTRSISISTVDASTKELTSTVTWQQNAQRTGSVSATTRLTNWLAAVAATWVNPNTLAGSLNFAGLQDGLKVALQGTYAYVVRNDGTPDFAIVDIAIPANPIFVGSLALAGVPRNITVSGNYAFIASTDNAQEFKVISITNPDAPVQVGSYDAPGNADANGIFVVGTTAYLVRTLQSSDPELIILDVANPATPVLLGAAQLSDTGNEVFVQGTAAYVASNSNTQELQVLDVANPAAVAQVASVNLAGNSNAFTLAGVASTLLIGQGNVLHILSTANPLAPVALGSLDVQGTVNDISVSFGNGGALGFIATSTSSAELQVVDVSVPDVPALVGSYDALGALFGIAYDSTADRAYAVGAHAVEFIAVQP